MADGGQLTTGGDDTGVTRTLAPDASPDASPGAAADTFGAGAADGFDEPLVGPPPPRRWLAPALAAAVLLVIAVGVTARGGRHDGAGLAARPPGTAQGSATPSTAAATPTVAPVPTTASTPATAAPALPTTTIARLGNGEPLLGEPLALSLYAAHPPAAGAPAYLERIDVDTGVRTRIPFDHADRIRRLVVVGDELVVIGDDISAIGPSGVRVVLGGQGFERSIHGEIASMIVTDDGRTVLRFVDVRKRNAITDVPLPAGTTRAYPDGGGRIVYERPGSAPNGGGVYWMSADGTGEAHATGWGSLRSAERGRFQEAACEGSRCRLMLHDLADATVKTIYDGPGAFDTIGVADIWMNYIFMATAPSKSSGANVLLRVPDGVTFTLPGGLSAQPRCDIEPCPAALPVWSDGGESLWGIDADHHAFGWRPGLDVPVRLADLGPVEAVAVGANDTGPLAP